MRIAIISDLHANFVALETVLADIERARVDQIICLGDVTAGGPQPRETIQRVRDLGCPVVRGNTDEWFLVPQTYDPNSEKERRLMALLEWAMQQFAPADIEFMRAFPLRVELSLENGKTLLGFHGSPQAHTHVIWATTPDDELARMFGNYRATVMAGGHTHAQMLRRFGDTLLVNPGSVGLPVKVGATPEMNRRVPWSEYAIVASRGDDLAVEFRRVPLDVSAVVRAARESGMPNAEEWAGEWIAQ